MPKIVHDSARHRCGVRQNLRRRAGNARPRTRWRTVLRRGAPVRRARPVHWAHAMGQSFSYCVRCELVRGTFLSSAYLRESGDGHSGLGRRARAADPDGAQADALHHAARRAGAAARSLAVAGLWHRPWPGQRLDARQAVRRAAGAGLPPCLRPAAAQVQADAGTGARRRGGRHPEGGQLARRQGNRTHRRLIQSALAR